MNKDTVLITGASSGIGLELARCFAADKANLILVARTTAAMEKLATELRQKHGIEVHVITANLSRAESPQEIYEELKGRGMIVDVLVNNAGFGLLGSFAELPLHRQLEMIQVNITALVTLTGLFMPGMLQRRRGGILNVGSVAGFFPGPNMAVYYATKAFVLSFSEALYEELRGTGIRVTNICPGPTDTNFSQVARSHRVRDTKVGKMSAAEVAHIGYEDFQRGQCLSVTGWKNKLLTTVGTTLLPRKTTRKLVKHYNQLK